MSLLRRGRITSSFLAWTLLVWVTRMRNIWTDAELDTTGRLGPTALALSFTIGAVAAAVALWGNRRSASWGPGRWLVAALAGWTAVVWVVRMVGIVTADHGAGFVAVHLALAVVSIALGVAAAREVFRSGPGHRIPSPTASRT